MSSPKGIAFYDFDGTILTRESGPIYGVEMFKSGVADVLPSFMSLFAALGYKAKMVRRTTVAEIGVQIYGGLKKEEIDDWFTTQYKLLIRPLISRIVNERIKAHKKSGFLNVMLSASPPFYFRETLKELKMDAGIGSDLSFENGICTGKYKKDYLNGRVKLVEAEAFAKKKGVKLKNCAFYTDHIADLPLMEKVGRPVAVGPESRLRELAEKRGWEIMEHKEVLFPA